MPKAESELYLTHELEEIARKSRPSPDNNDESWWDFEEAVYSLQGYYGGKVVGDESSIGLCNYHLEGVPVSFTVRLSSEQPRGHHQYPSWGELTRLEAGGIDWLGQRVNPRGARVFIQVFECGYPRINHTLSNLSSPWDQRDRKMALRSTALYGDSMAECAIFWNPLLVSDLRQMGERIPDASLPRVSVPLPFSIENLFVAMHEFKHVSPPYEQTRDYHLKLIRLHQRSKRPGLDELEVAELNQEKSKVFEANEIKTQALATEELKPILKEWGIQSYEQRLLEFEEHWKAELLAWKLKSIEKTGNI